MRDRGIDIDGFAGHAAALFHRYRAQRAHIVQPVSQLHENHAHVARHRQQHFAEVFRLRLLAIAKLHLVELGQAVDKFGDLGAEALSQLGLGDALVLHHVVQQRGHDRLRVELPVGADLGDRDGMGNIGFAALAVLAQVGLVAEVERRLDVLQLGFGQIAGQHLGQLRDRDDFGFARLFGGRGWTEQVPERLLEHRIDIAARRRTFTGGLGERLRRGGGGEIHGRLLTVRVERWASRSCVPQERGPGKSPGSGEPGAGPGTGPALGSR